MRYLAVVATLLVLLIPAVSAPHVTRADRMWSAACDLVAEHRDYSCDGLEKPQVIYKTLDAEGLWGYFSGGDTIYVSSDMEPRERNKTLVHEMIHYIHSELGLLHLPGPARMVCWSEAEAWILEGIYSSKDRSSWWHSYEFCWPFYGTDIYEHKAS